MKPVHKPQPYTAYRLAVVLVMRPEARTAWQRTYLERLCAADEQIARTYQQVERFTSMVRQRQGTDLDPWLADVGEQGVGELRTFAAGLQEDYAAVRAGLSLPWSAGQTEGQIQRLKLLKRQTYGRAGFALLRQRVLANGQQGASDERQAEAEEAGARAA